MSDLDVTVEQLEIGVVVHAVGGSVAACRRKQRRAARSRQGSVHEQRRFARIASCRQGAAKARRTLARHQRSTADIQCFERSRVYFVYRHQFVMTSG